MTGVPIYIIIISNIWCFSFAHAITSYAYYTIYEQQLQQKNHHAFLHSGFNNVL